MVISAVREACVSRHNAGSIEGLSLNPSIPSSKSDSFQGVSWIGSGYVCKCILIYIYILNVNVNQDTFTHVRGWCREAPVSQIAVRLICNLERLWATTIFLIWKRFYLWRGFINNCNEYSSNWWVIFSKSSDIIW